MIRTPVLALTLAGGLGLAGCTTTAQEQGALTGAAVGGAGGALAGALIDDNNRGRGALIGGGLGAVAGTVIGANQARERGLPYDARAGCYYDPNTRRCVAFR